MHPSCGTLVMAGGEYEDQDVIPLNSLPLEKRALHTKCADPMQTGFPGQQACLPMEKQVYMAKAVGSRTTPKHPSGNDHTIPELNKIGR